MGKSSPSGTAGAAAPNPIEVPRADLTQYSLRDVVAAELDEIIQRRVENRRLRDEKNRDRESEGNQPKVEATEPRSTQAPEDVRDNLVGLALSGGGIRSGAFSLGVLAALKKSGVMDLVDYLSTVSGGGYAGAYWSTRAINSGLATSKDARKKFASEQDISIDEHGRASLRLLRFIHSGSYLAHTVNFINRYTPGLVMILLMAFAGLITGASGLAWLFREIDRPKISDAIAALGFDGDILRALFPTVCWFAIWSLAWLASYVKHGTHGRGWVAGLLLWPLMISSLASLGTLLSTGDIGFPAVETLLGASANERTVPQSFWYVLYSVVGASLLPYLRLPMLIRSGIAPTNVMEKYVFRVASAALLIGVPFVAFTWMAQENISEHLESRSPEVVEADVFAGLQPNERQVLFDVFRVMGDMDEQEEFGVFDLREELERLRDDDKSQSKLSDEQITSLLQLATKFVFEPNMLSKELDRSLSKLLELEVGEYDRKIRQDDIPKIKKLMHKARDAMRDWKSVEQHLLPLLTTTGLKIDYMTLIRGYLNDEIDSPAALKEELRKREKTQGKARHSKYFDDDDRFEKSSRKSKHCILLR